MTLLNVIKNKQPQRSTCQSTATDKGNEQKRFVRPAYRIGEQDTAYRVHVDMPGVQKGDVEISLVDGVLELTAKRASVAEGDWKPLGAAQVELTYRLRLAVGDEVDGQGISAKLENGVLLVTLPKAEEKRPRRIAVS